MAGWRIAIDRGGTFTDVIATHPDGRQRVLKLLSAQSDGSLAEAQAIESVLAEGGMLESLRVGTTVGTNAMLERKGARTAMLLTRGFGDLLHIGYQARPALFDLYIRKPEPLADSCHEIDERLDATGGVLKPLDAQQARDTLERLRAEGCEALAIALLHSWKNPVHELQLAELARSLGFAHVQLSHEVSPTIRLLPRAETTLVDAYLTPVLATYLATLQREAKLATDTSLHFMQSHGGLVEGEAFRGRDCLLSGPAGGILGAQAAGRLAGYDRLLSFDMGGTSTDVAHIAGEPERTHESELAGVRVHTPMLAIHTIAAGGGSCLRFEDGRFQVGPDSAGAQPGPACYGRGGPLAITDAQAVLGRLPPEHLPKVFGRDGRQPLDPDAARRGFEALSAEVSEQSGQPLSVEEAAEGFLSIAVEKMAQAIRSISVERGYSIDKYALCAFGGAGGQHACRVAEALGVRTVLLHPQAGILSAWGISLAKREWIRQQSLLKPLDTHGLKLAEELTDTLATSLRSEALQGGLDETALEASAQLHLRYAGNESTLAVPASSLEEARANFERAHQTRYGFIFEERPIEIARVELRLVERAQDFPSQSDAHEARQQRKATHVRACLGGRWQDVPCYERESLPAGAELAGPAIVTEQTATTIVESGWSARLDPHGNLLLTQAQASESQTTSSETVDPIRLELYNRRFMAIAEEMGQALRATARSVNIRERLDYSCALFDAEGHLLANAPHIPVHLGSMADAVQAWVQAEGEAIREGDAWLLNSPYHGGTHLPDLTVISPVFDAEGVRRFFTASRGHHEDVGGITPGSMPTNASHIAQEGCLCTGLKILEGGRFQRERVLAWLASGDYPARLPERNLADLEAQLAANHRGQQAIGRLLREQGEVEVLAYAKHVRENARTIVAEALREIAPAEAGLTMDDGAYIHCELRKEAEGLPILDFSASSKPQSTNINAPAAIARAAVLYVLRCLLDRDVPLNSGCLEAIDLRLGSETLFNPQYPAPVAAGNVETSQYVTDCLLMAFGLLAGSQGTMNNLTFGNADCQYYETIAGGSGAGDGFAGADAVQCHMTNTRITDPEILETRLPVRLLEFAIRRGSGGAGRWHGGDGALRSLEALVPLKASLLTSHRNEGPRGLEGGRNGQAGRNTLVRNDGSTSSLPHRCSFDWKVGEVLRIETPGGGGYREVISPAGVTKAGF